VSRLSTVFLGVALSLARVSSAQTPRGKTEPPKGVDAALYQALEWRNIGPFRGGRVTAVAGVPSKPWTFLRIYRRRRVDDRGRGHHLPAGFTRPRGRRCAGAHCWARSG